MVYSNEKVRQLVDASTLGASTVSLIPRDVTVKWKNYSDKEGKVPFFISSFKCFFV